MNSINAARTATLPRWRDAPDVRRAWGRAIRAAGKQRTIACLVPVAQYWLKFGPQPAPGASNQTARFSEPEAVAAALKDALDELASVGFGSRCRLVLEEEHLVGIKASSRPPLAAARLLILAASARSRFHVYLLQGLELLCTHHPTVADDLYLVLIDHVARTAAEHDDED